MGRNKSGRSNRSPARERHVSRRELQHRLERELRRERQCQRHLSHEGRNSSNEDSDPSFTPPGPGRSRSRSATRAQLHVAASSRVLSRIDTDVAASPRKSGHEGNLSTRKEDRRPGGSVPSAMKRHLNTHRTPSDAVDIDLNIDGSLHGTTFTESARCASVDRFSHDSAHTHNDDRALDNTAPNNTPDDGDVLMLHNEDNPEDPLDLPSTVLAILGDDPTAAKPGSYRLHKAICTRWEHILTNGVGKENLLELHARHVIPDNCPLLSPPKINPEIQLALTPAYITRDHCHQRSQ
nr:unnamed protein product [Callosobruchus chinensis]